MGRMRVISAKHKCSQCDGDLEYDPGAVESVPGAVWQFWCVDCGHGLQEVYCPVADAKVVAGQQKKIEVPK